VAAKKSPAPLPSFPACEPCPHYRRVIWTPTTFVCLDCLAHCRMMDNGTIVPLVTEAVQNLVDR
jgi:hypothetical protein